MKRNRSVSSAPSPRPSPGEPRTADARPRRRFIVIFTQLLVAGLVVWAAINYVVLRSEPHAKREAKIFSVDELLYLAARNAEPEIHPSYDCPANNDHGDDLKTVLIPASQLVGWGNGASTLPTITGATMPSK